MEGAENLGVGRNLEDSVGGLHEQEGDHEHEQDQDDEGIRVAGGCRGALETMHRSEETATTWASNVRQHFYVDVQNPEESNYDREEQHIAIDPTFFSTSAWGVHSIVK
jgi:hypothetical protein